MKANLICKLVGVNGAGLKVFNDYVTEAAGFIKLWFQLRFSQS